ncbi:MAG: hypothetical protein HUK14_05960 [Muribaculaceae bacterium]|nr:hypothetical protein [Muribaculaceae bacterium]
MIRNTHEENKLTFVWVVLLLAAMLVGLLCSSCSKKVVEVVEVPQVSYVHDTLRVVDRDVQQIYVRDSITVKGDTVTRDRLVWRDRVRSDTVYKAVERVDTVTVVKAVYRDKESEGGSWWWLWLLLGAGAGFFIYWKIFR